MIRTTIVLMVNGSRDVTSAINKHIKYNPTLLLFTGVQGLTKPLPAAYAWRAAAGEGAGKRYNCSALPGISAAWARSETGARTVRQLTGAYFNAPPIPTTPFPPELLTAMRTALSVVPVNVRGGCKRRNAFFKSQKASCVTEFLLTASRVWSAIT
jgi:hypothetical protein